MYHRTVAGSETADHYVNTSFTVILFSRSPETEIVETGIDVLSLTELLTVCPESRKHL